MTVQSVTAGEPYVPQLKECRVWQRLPCDVHVACRPVSDLPGQEETWAAYFRDLSRGGVSLLLSRRFERGTCIAIEIPGTAARRPCTLLAHIRYTKRLPNGFWRSGCKLASELSPEELEGLLA